MVDEDGRRLADKLGEAIEHARKFGKQELADRLHDSGIQVSVSRPASTLLDASARRLPDIVRASPHYYNSADDLARFLRAVREIIAG